MRFLAPMLLVVVALLLWFGQSGSVPVSLNPRGESFLDTDGFTNSSGKGEEVHVLRVIDGDTIEVRVGGKTETVRYIGIDTPETVHPDKPVQCFGPEASARNRELLAGGTVRLVRDISDRDRYGRLLRYVYVDDTFINKTLVEEGYATVTTYPPDVAHADEFVELQRLAREEKRGLWSSCLSQNDLSPAVAVPSCSIKGNISVSGERIYHTLGCEYYDRTVIDESKGERWFCSEEEALEAGWRKALNCT